jgi:ribosomal protein S18 acetylase RimI-like enzyme
MTTLSPMTTAEFEAWRETQIPVYAHDKVVCGEWSEAESLARSRAEVEALLPDGLETLGHHLWSIRDAAQAGSIGALWVAVQQSDARRVAYVFDLIVKPAYRGQGHARRAFQALEAQVREMQLDGIALHVFGHNAAARALYESLGYAETNIMMFKPLP